MRRKLLGMALVLLILGGFPSAEGADLPALKVSENHRFLVTETGQPFFYLGDTAWELFHRLNREEAEKYLQTRARQGFNVIQAVALSEVDGHSVPNPYGHLPLVDLDPARPAVVEGDRNDYWDHVDFIVDRANSLGMYVGFLPTWGRYWHDKIHNDQPLFQRENAEKYGEWLGRRYKDKKLIWILGGDRKIENDEQAEIIRAMARGIRRHSSSLMTFHPPGGAGSAQWFHNEPWLDFNMRQNGHETEFPGRYDATRADYDRTPPKPVIDAEPIYEGHPIAFNAKKFGHSLAADVRRPLYWDLFSGACGHTYGHHSIWQFWQPGRLPINDPLMPWQEALEEPGAGQMIHGRRLIESRPFFDRIPDDSILVTDRVATLIPGAGRNRFVATRDRERTYAMIYAPAGRAFRVHMDAIASGPVRAWWFNPRTGEATTIGEFPNTGEKEFLHPNPGEQIDWILVLDDAGKKYPATGLAAESK